MTWRSLSTCGFWTFVQGMFRCQAQCCKRRQVTSRTPSVFRTSHELRMAAPFQDVLRHYRAGSVWRKWSHRHKGRQQMDCWTMAWGYSKVVTKVRILKKKKKLWPTSLAVFVIDAIINHVHFLYRSLRISNYLNVPFNFDRFGFHCNGRDMRQRWFTRAPSQSKILVYT